MSTSGPGFERAARPGLAPGAVDEGLRAYMLSVYNYMAGGVLLSGIVAYLIYSFAVTTDPGLAANLPGGGVPAIRSGLFLTPFGQALFRGPAMLVVALAPLGFVFFLSWRVGRMSLGGAQLAFWLFAAVMGASLSTIFLRYTATSIAQIFFITAAAFGALSLYGYTTRRDLSGWGGFLIMGVVGIIIAAVVNLFLQSSALQFAVSIIGVLVFAGLTAYDTQRIKELYYSVAGDGTAAGKAAIMGALSLYLDFINIFTSMLSLFGNRN
ncbi:MULTISPECIES: Bax inhibitor-1/YccA family protein [Rhodomicrobium]|uniref:Bax inhibitor-1/YccA family protein n=1 Tax=Rhodomicrobium TaxID=1068 RepID=UPI000B4BAF00|nr:MULTISPECIES: Bax inhibitor-1/YccA family protein [Rhodomicrobium]